LLLSTTHVKLNRPRCNCNAFAFFFNYSINPFNKMATSNKKQPVWFVPHGGGPMPLLDGDTLHIHLNAWWSKLAADAAAMTTPPTAICVVSAHWEETKATVQVRCLVHVS
jgi:hypothetical protein